MQGKGGPAALIPDFSKDYILSPHEYAPLWPLYCQLLAPQVHPPGRTPPEAMYRYILTVLPHVGPTLTPLYRQTLTPQVHASPLVAGGHVPPQPCRTAPRVPR